MLYAKTIGLEIDAHLELKKISVFPGQNGVSRFYLTPDGKQIHLMTDGGKGFSNFCEFVIYDLEKKIIKEIHSFSSDRIFKWLKPGEMLLTGDGLYGETVVRKLENNEMKEIISFPSIYHNNGGGRVMHAVTSMDGHASGEYVAVCGDNSIQILHLPSQQCFPYYVMNDGLIAPIEKKSQKLISEGEQTVYTPLIIDEYCPSQLAFTPDGKLLLIYVPKSGIFVFDFDKGHLKEKFHLKMFKEASYAQNFVVSSDSQWVIYADDKNRLVKTNLMDQARQVVLEIDASPYIATVSAMAISPNGNLLATGDKNNTIKIWNLLNNKLIVQAKSKISKDGILFLQILNNGLLAYSPGFSANSSKTGMIKIVKLKKNDR
jgi:WD40 repeat protein